MILLTALSSIAMATSNPELPTIDTSCHRTNTAFNVGESLSYKFSFKWGAIWLSAGEATMAITEGTIANKPCYHITGFGQTYESYDWFFKVRDKYETYVNKETLLPMKFIRDVDEGGYTIYNNVTFKHAEHKAISTNGVYKIPDCLQDVISAIYYMRTYDMTNVKLNDVLPVTIFIDDSIYPLYVRFVGKEHLKSKFGEWDCLKIKPLTVEGTIFKGGEDMIVYVTDDKNHIPVAITSPILIGEIRADLFKASGVRNPMAGKLTE